MVSVVTGSAPLSEIRAKARLQMAPSVDEWKVQLEKLHPTTLAQLQLALEKFQRQMKESFQEFRDGMKEDLEGINESFAQRRLSQLQASPDLSSPPTTTVVESELVDTEEVEDGPLRSRVDEDEPPVLDKHKDISLLPLGDGKSDLELQSDLQQGVVCSPEVVRPLLSVLKVSETLELGTEVNQGVVLLSSPFLIEFDFVKPPAKPPDKLPIGLSWNPAKRSRKAVASFLKETDSPNRSATFADYVPATFGFHFPAPATHCSFQNDIFDTGSLLHLSDANFLLRVDLRKGKLVAVKKFYKSKSKEDESLLDMKNPNFEADDETPGKIWHKDILKLWCCYNTDRCKLLSYECMPQGSSGGLPHNSKVCFLSGDFGNYCFNCYMHRIAEGLNAFELMLVAIFKFVQQIYYREAMITDFQQEKIAKECKIIVDIIELAVPGGLPQRMGEDCKLQEMCHKALKLLPKLWVEVGFLKETIGEYRLALAKPWTLDCQSLTRIHKLSSMLHYGGVKAIIRPHTLGWVIHTPKNNTKEAVLLLFLLTKNMSMRVIDWGPGILYHLTHALSVSGTLGSLANHLEQILPGNYDRAVRWYYLALCYSGACQPDAALNLLNKLLGRSEEKHRPYIPSLLLGAKLCLQGLYDAHYGIKFALTVFDLPETSNNRFSSEAHGLLGVCSSNAARLSVSDLERILSQQKSLISLKGAAPIGNANVDPELIFSLGLENVEQRNLNAEQQEYLNARDFRVVAGQEMPTQFFQPISREIHGKTHNGSVGSCTKVSKHGVALGRCWFVDHATRDGLIENAGPVLMGRWEPKFTLVFTWFSQPRPPEFKLLLLNLVDKVFEGGKICCRNLVRCCFKLCQLLAKGKKVIVKANVYCFK